MSLGNSFKLPKGVSCPFCISVFDRGTFSPRKYAKRIHCPNCRRYFHIWEADLYNSNGEKVTENYIETLRYLRKKYIEKRIDDKFNEMSSLIEKISNTNEKELRDIQDSIKDMV